MVANGPVARCPHCGEMIRRADVAPMSPQSRAALERVLKSRQPGQMSMRQRGRLGGRPKALTLKDLPDLSVEQKPQNGGVLLQRPGR